MRRQRREREADGERAWSELQIRIDQLTRRNAELASELEIAREEVREARTEVESQEREREAWSAAFATLAQAARDWTEQWRARVAQGIPSERDTREQRLVTVSEQLESLDDVEHLAFELFAFASEELRPGLLGRARSEAGAARRWKRARSRVPGAVWSLRCILGVGGRSSGCDLGSGWKTVDRIDHGR